MDTNESIYSLFEGVVTETSCCNTINVTTEMLHQGSFVARITVREMHRHPTMQGYEIVKFDPITVKWPNIMVEDPSNYDGEYWQRMPLVPQAVPPTQLSEALYFSTFKNETQARHVRLKVQNGEPVRKLVRFKLKRTAKSFEPAVSKIDVFLSR